jgi:hypothetical protein
VFTSSLPWLTAEPPHVIISRHGLALWVTTPALLLLLSPVRQSPVLRALTWAVIPVVILNLMYQNSGWVQFGYRFALDYLPLLFVMLALGGRRFGKRFIAVGVFAIVAQHVRGGHVRPSAPVLRRGPHADGAVPAGLTLAERLTRTQAGGRSFRCAWAAITRCTCSSVAFARA